MADDKKAKIEENLPCSPEVEKNVLGIAIVDEESRAKLFSVLTDDSFFYIPKHKIIYNALANIYRRNEKIEGASLITELRNTKQLTNAGGINYIFDCADSVVTPKALKDYIKILQDQADLRNLLIAVRTIQVDYESGQISDIPSFINESEQLFKDTIKKRRITEFSHSSQLGEKARALIEKMEGQTIRGLEGYETGFPSLDKITGGLKKGEVTILAARPNLGKTALALNIAQNCAQANRVAVAVFSLESTEEKIYNRLVAAGSNVPADKIARFDLAPYDRQKVFDAIRKLSALDIYFESTPNIKLNEIVAKCHNLYATLHNEGKKLGLIIVDYIGLIKVVSKRPNVSVQDEIRAVSQEMIALAKDLNVPILLLSQLSRKVEDRGGRPQMADLRDSGSLEQDADVVILLHRDDYQKDSKKNDADRTGKKKLNQLSFTEKLEAAQQRGLSVGEYGEYTSTVEVIVAKNRNGGTGATYLFFHRNVCKYSPITDDTMKSIKSLENEYSD